MRKIDFLKRKEIFSFFWKQGDENLLLFFDLYLAVWQRSNLRITLFGLNFLFRARRVWKQLDLLSDRTFHKLIASKSANFIKKKYKKLNWLISWLKSYEIWTFAMLLLGYSTYILIVKNDTVENKQTQDLSCFKAVFKLFSFRIEWLRAGVTAGERRKKLFFCAALMSVAARPDLSQF